MHPLCFILMPFGRKPAGDGRFVDFDLVYEQLIKPAVVAADLEPLRADEEQAGGVIHKPMFERLILCEYAVADLTTANANVFYELGIRHAVRPASTILIFAGGAARLPFDVAPLRGLAYHINKDGQPVPDDPAIGTLTQRLVEARRAKTDSPVYQLVDGFPDIQHLKTDVFRGRVQYCDELRKRIAAARDSGIEAIRAVARELGDIRDAEAGVVIDLFLSYRAVRAWDEMISLVEAMGEPLATTVMIREQLALALNRAGRSREAEQVLCELIRNRGPSSETYGLLGRVYKDRWETAVKAGKGDMGRGFLTKAIEAYLKGFETDWRDAYPGVNAVTLMELQEPPDLRRLKVIPVVRYAVGRRIEQGTPDYWDWATLLELAVLAGDKQEATDAFAKALASVRERWEPETTARNLRLIREARVRRGKPDDWAVFMEDELMRCAAATMRNGA